MSKFVVNVTLANGYSYYLEAASKAAATRKAKLTLAHNPNAAVDIVEIG
ncbi:hypothetical protein [Mesorhizobium sp.]|nr:hypothetical protein [Mesorhizobium sp.]